MTAKTEEISIICAWCNKHMGIKEVIASPGMEGAATHTICPVCFEKNVGHMHPPVVDEAFVMEAQMLATGRNVHDLNQAIGGYQYAPEWYAMDCAAENYEGMSKSREMHTECERRIKGIIAAEKVRRSQVTGMSVKAL